MATLEECVKSGRRWRHRRWKQWRLPDEIGSVAVIASDALSSDFEIEPEPEKPREWTLHHDVGFGQFHRLGHHDSKTDTTCEVVRVHDADACDRLQPEARISCTIVQFEQMIDAYKKWKASGEGAAMQWGFWGPYAKFEVRRG